MSYVNGNILLSYVKCSQHLADTVMKDWRQNAVIKCFLACTKAWFQFLTLQKRWKKMRYFNGKREQTNSLPISIYNLTVMTYLDHSLSEDTGSLSIQAFIPLFTQLFFTMYQLWTRHSIKYWRSNEMRKPLLPVLFNLIFYSSEGKHLLITQINLICYPCYEGKGQLPVDFH